MLGVLWGQAPCFRPAVTAPGAGWGGLGGWGMRGSGMGAQGWGLRAQRSSSLPSLQHPQRGHRRLPAQGAAGPGAFRPQRRRPVSGRPGLPQAWVLRGREGCARREAQPGLRLRPECHGGQCPTPRPVRAWRGPLLRTSVRGIRVGLGLWLRVMPTFPAMSSIGGRYVFRGRGRTHLPNEGRVAPGKATAAG